MAQTKTKKILSSVGKELKKNPPKILAKTAEKKGAAQAEKQRKAILLNKARAKGAKVGFNAGGFERARRSHFKMGTKSK
jgi:hypothetical protein